MGRLDRAARTFVIAASYEAKAYGIKTGTRVDEAKRMCPGLILTEGSPALYVYYHERVLEVVQKVLFQYIAWTTLDPTRDNEFVAAQVLAGGQAVARRDAGIVEDQAKVEIVQHRAPERMGRTAYLRGGEVSDEVGSRPGGFPR